jgi:hypothetical protein
MFYIVYDKSTTRAVKKASGNMDFATSAAAKRHMTRNHLSTERYAIAEYQDYCDNIEAKVERVNLMSGQKYMESINTPGYMSPASEAYWSA